MALKWKREPAPDDPRLSGHESDYKASQGWWGKSAPKPVPGTPKEEK